MFLHNGLYTTCSDNHVHADNVAGCGTLWSLDGNWKLTYPICMYRVPKNVPFGGTLQYVSSCPKQPVPNMAFCVEHCEIAKKQKIPSELHEYLKYSNRVTAPKVDQLPQTSEVQETAADCQGIIYS